MVSETQTTKQFSWVSALRARHAALPSEHGAWVFLLSPLVIGLVLGGARSESLLLITAAMAAFLVRQPVTIAVKACTGRRPKSELAVAGFWLAIYGLFGTAAVAGLAALGYSFLFWLALPALPVFAWHLWLVSRRAERRQILVEILASGVLALAAPAAYWVGQAQVGPAGWLLWGLCWAQVAGTIVYAYLRLEQRQLKQAPARREAVSMARAAFFYNLALLLVIVVLSIGQVVPALLPLAYLIQPVEVVWGALHPAVGVKPKAIGIRQLVISILFTLVFIFAWL